MTDFYNGIQEDLKQNLSNDVNTKDYSDIKDISPGFKTLDLNMFKDLKQKKFKEENKFLNTQVHLTDSLIIEEEKKENEIMISENENDVVGN